jgi:hypothetical protein
MRLKTNKMFVLVIKNDLLDTIRALIHPNVKWCTLVIMFETEAITNKLNFYTKFYDMEMQEGRLCEKILIADRLVHAMLNMMPPR